MISSAWGEYAAVKEVPGTGLCVALVRTVGGGQIIRGTNDYVVERWSYADFATATDQFDNWSGYGEPGDWIRHQPSNRRRVDGDPRKEYVRS